MKFSCSRPELYEIVSNVSRAVSGKTSLAVLEGILLFLLIRKTKIGQYIRAGVDNRSMTSALGININLV